MRFIYSYLWILPFITFITGYQVLHFVTYKAVIKVPNVIGQHIHDAIKMLSDYKLNARILDQKEDANLPEGLVISQSPSQDQSIKTQQSVFLVVTRKPPKPLSPSLYGLTLDQAKLLAQEKAIRLKFYFIETCDLQGTCIAQSNQPNEELVNKEIAAYFSSGTTCIRIFPNLKAKPVPEVIDFLKSYGIEVKLMHLKPIELTDSTHTCSNCIVIGQSPLPGSLINLKKQLTVQLTVEQVDNYMAN